MNKKKLLVKILAVVMAVVVLVAVLVSCAKKTSEVNVFADFKSQADKMPTAMKTISFASTASSIKYEEDEIVSYTDGTGATATNFNLYSLKDNKLIIAGHKDNIGVSVTPLGKNTISVVRTVTVDDGTQLFMAVYNKQGEVLVDFTGTHTQYVPIVDNIYAWNNKIYNGKTVIIDGAKSFVDGSTSLLTPIKELGFLVYQTEYKVDIYDYNGKLVYAGTIPSDTAFRIISKNKGLFQTRFDLPDDASSYTYFEDGKKYRVVNEVVDFATGVKTAVNLNYVFDFKIGTPPYTMDNIYAGETFKLVDLTDEAKGLVLIISAKEIVGGVLGKVDVSLVLDENLAIKKVVSEESSQPLGGDRYFVTNRISNSFSIKDGSGKVIKLFNSTDAKLDKNSGLIKVKTNDNLYDYYDFDGKLVIDSANFVSPVEFVYGSGGYATNVTKKDANGNVLVTVKNDGTTTNLVLKSDGAEYSLSALAANVLWKKNKVGESDYSILNAKGDTLATVKTADVSLLNWTGGVEWKSVTDENNNLTAIYRLVQSKAAPYAYSVWAFKV